MFRLLTLAATVFCLIYGYFWLDTNHPELQLPKSIKKESELQTLEVQYSVEQIMNLNKRTLVRNRRYTFLDSALKFYPYVLMEVKYLAPNHKTKESLLLWDLTDGEIVLNSKTWDKTHGMGDCILAGAKKEDFELLQTIHLRGGSTTVEACAKTLDKTPEQVRQLLESCSKKQLIIAKNGKVKIHLESPVLPLSPETKFTHALVTKPYQGAMRISARFSTEQITKVAKELFGEDFVLRKSTDIYLPVHAIAVQNPDGSMETSHWNGLNGKRLDSKQKRR